MLIETGFHAAEIAEGVDCGQDVSDIAEIYAAILKRKIQRFFPDAEIVISYSLGESGALPFRLQTRINGVDAEGADGPTQFNLMLVEDAHARAWVSLFDEYLG